MPERRLHERPTAVDALEARAASRRVIPVGECTEWKEREVLREREAEGEVPRRNRRPPPHELEGEAEDGAVRGMKCDSGDGPGPGARHELAEQRHVRVVVSDDLAVDTLGGAPHECGGGSCGHRARKAHARTVPRPLPCRRCPKGTRSIELPAGCRCSWGSGWPSSRFIRAPGPNASPSGSTGASSRRWRRTART